MTDIEESSAFICNETMLVEHGIVKAWKDWLYSHYIPKVRQSKCFIRCRVLQLHNVDESEGITFAIQWEAVSKASVNKYLEIYLPEIAQETQQLWGEHCLGFRTVMEVLDDVASAEKSKD